ncbi:MAG TPA: sodium-dependent transporter [Cyclobacteriaceae bacterium]|nr:sodium-dependent transporter [Cyclobacteriaceae bacterium]
MTSPKYTSTLTSLLTMIGVAVGLGNVWRFPYMMGSYGGSAFLAVYLGFTLLFAFPALMAEMTLGRMSGKGTLDSFRIIFGNNIGGFIGLMLLVVITISGSYYVVVVANVIYTSAYSIIFGFGRDNIEGFKSGLNYPQLQYGITLLLIATSLFVIHKGLTRGIEWLSKIIMPFFLLAMGYMIFNALSLPGALDKFTEFLSPDLSRLHATEIFAALGQAFFSVGLGGTFVVVYAAYINQNESIPKMALLTGLGDVSASLLVSLFLVPSMLVFGMDMASGPGLIFDTFPRLFATMPAGRWIGSLFLIALTLVAFLSLIAAYQVPFVSIQNERPELPPKKTLVAIGVVQGMLALPCAFSPDLIGILDLIFGSGMQVLGSALCVLGITWGYTRLTARESLFTSSGNTTIQKLAFAWIKWIIPLALLAVLAGYVYDSFMN